MDWGKKCHEMYHAVLEENSMEPERYRLDADSQLVLDELEVEQSLFFKHKYNRSHGTQSQWVFRRH